MSTQINGQDIPYFPSSPGDGSTLVANSASSTGVAWSGPTFVAGRNKIINGDFGIWQRGTSFTNASTQVYTSDRWIAGSASDTVTVSQQTFTPGSAPVTGYEGATYLQMAWASTNIGYPAIIQRIEDVRTFAGQTVTVSFWAKATSTISGYPYSVIKQNFGSGGSSQVSTYSSTFSLTTSWTRYSLTYTIPSISGKTIGSSSYLEVQPLYLNPGAAANTVSIWGVQLEAGSVATPFTTATGTIQGELAACQRYYENNYPIGYAPGSSVASAIDTSQTLFAVVVNGGTAGGNRAKSTAWPYKVTKRATPTGHCWDLSGNLNKYTSGNADGSQIAGNNSFDTYGAIEFVNATSIALQTITASSSHYYAMVMWEASSEL